MKLENIKNLLNKKIICPSKWELDTIVWSDRTKNPKILIEFLERIDNLNSKTNDQRTESEQQELRYLLELLEDMSEEECQMLLSTDDEFSKNLFIENLARRAALEVLCREKVTEETMSIACKLNPTEFVLCAKRTQDLIDAIISFTVKGEKLSKEFGGA